MIDNKNLRLKILNMIVRSGEGHIPSSFSIVDVVNFLYLKVMNINKKNYKSPGRDYFILSKGHGCAALYVVLEKIGILNSLHIKNYSSYKSVLGGHPDCTKVPGAEASTGSLGHGFPTAVGIALGLKIKKEKNKVYALLGDGECHEGTIWESANIASNRNLNNLTAVVDWNGSAKQLMPKDDLINKWKSFGWNVFTVDGHSTKKMYSLFKKIKNKKSEKPTVVLAVCIKGKGIKEIEGHGQWHHKLPNESDYKKFVEILKK
jgi:transketolase